MSLSDIENKIKQDTKAEADKIIAEAKEQVARIIKEAETKAEKEKNEILSAGEKEAQNLKRALITPAKLAAKKKILEEKRKILEQAFQGKSKETREKKEIEVAKVLFC
ncbi:hypothetical protein A3J90_03655 [candidate division WOR-1 bacterium RIFOXYC2_FULL_37_10]|uniref:Uncharacterized protein n=1 Tax=candidate division WOR-1 bacterium RIFOXYB2_FULL_37_13 TaxID=1802579 RepID=A0A1F4SEC3_UNCSA|nr:MAG: hypothetical protein A2246_01420 [candidate division WOR-1 bacterium RIFOXYA2_FULL_37_7]OGC18759.1 MAG: hypothetical protein A2310_02585 [candidate division WOR-1 bacterium RIFOXYB2_FULL_37_13]OGC32660.1 MAG: hypothetical protein A3J90_03655 [candidate division WOR-1 bacterium RIFOXYC2_FULL_37_10]